MGRLERNIRRRIRRRIFVFSLLTIISLFLLAIIITNNVMVQMTGLPPERDVLSEYNINEYLVKIDEFKTHWTAVIQMHTQGWIDRLQKAVEELVNRIQLLFFL